MLRTQELSSTGKTVMNVVRGFSLVMVPLAGVVPSVSDTESSLIHLIIKQGV